MKNKVKQFLENQYENTQLSIGSIAQGKINYEGALKKGNKVIERENSEAIFEIGSITKIFTTTILAQLVNEGKVDLETPISDILPNKHLRKTGINLKNLANHTSGLPRLPDNFYSIANYDERNPYLNYDQDALNEYFEKYMNQNSKANGKFEYSNLGSGILAYTISKIESLPFQEIVRDRIFNPLNMNSSSFDINKKKDSVPGINQKGNLSNYWEGGILNGCIGIISSVKDLTKFMLYILDEKNENANLQLRETHEIGENHFIGLGWGIKTLSDGSRYFNHGGGSDGYSCFMKLHRATQRAIIILTNISAFNVNQIQLKELVNELL